MPASPSEMAPFGIDVNASRTATVGPTPPEYPAPFTTLSPEDDGAQIPTRCSQKPIEQVLSCGRIHRPP